MRISNGILLITGMILQGVIAPEWISLRQLYVVPKVELIRHNGNPGIPMR